MFKSPNLNYILNIYFLNNRSNSSFNFFLNIQIPPFYDFLNHFKTYMQDDKKTSMQFGK